MYCESQIYEPLPLDRVHKNQIINRELRIFVAFSLGKV